jgi:hypothetical protein
VLRENAICAEITAISGWVFSRSTMVAAWGSTVGERDLLCQTDHLAVRPARSQRATRLSLVAVLAKNAQCKEIMLRSPADRYCRTSRRPRLMIDGHQEDSGP